MEFELYKKLYGIVFIYDDHKNYQKYVDYFFSKCTDPIIKAEKNSVSTEHLDIYFYQKDEEFDSKFYKLRNVFQQDHLQIPEVIEIDNTNYKEKMDNIWEKVDAEISSLTLVYFLNTLAIKNNQIIYKRIILSERQKDILDFAPNANHRIFNDFNEMHNYIKTIVFSGISKLENDLKIKKKFFSEMTDLKDV